MHSRASRLEQEHSSRPLSRPTDCCSRHWSEQYDPRYHHSAFARAYDMAAPCEQASQSLPDFHFPARWLVRIPHYLQQKDHHSVYPHNADFSMQRLRHVSHSYPSDSGDQLERHRPHLGQLWRRDLEHDRVMYCHYKLLSHNDEALDHKSKHLKA